MITKNTKPTTGQCPSCGNYCNLKKDLDALDYCKDCRAQSPATKLTEELEKFENGQMRYASGEATFVNTLNSLSHGLGVYAALDSALRRLALLHKVNTSFVEENRILTEKLKSYESI